MSSHGGIQIPSNLLVIAFVVVHLTFCIFFLGRVGTIKLSWVPGSDIMIPSFDQYRVVEPIEFAFEIHLTKFYTSFFFFFVKKNICSHII